MKPALDYLALAFAWLPVSALLAAVTCLVWARLANRQGNHPRAKPWLSQGRTATT